jgi:hypothetical protein
MKAIAHLAKTLSLGAMVVALWGSQAEAKVDRVTVTAEVAQQGTKAATLEAAKREARRRAVEQGAGTLVQSNTIVRNYELIADEIVTSAKGILSDEKWGELEMLDGTAKITLTATVSKEAIESSICTVVKANHDPRIALVFVEKTGKENSDWKIERGLIESMFTDRLMDACFTMVEPAIKVTEVSARGDIPQDAIGQIVANTQAQYVLVGSGKFIESDVKIGNKSPSKMRSFSLSASVKLINVDTKEIEAVGAKNAQVLGISPEHAVSNPGQKKRAFGMIDGVLDQVFEKIAKRWSADLVGGSTVQLIVKKVSSFKVARRFEALAEKSFPQGSINRSSLKNKQAVYNIKVDGGADVFAEQIEGKKVGKKTVQVLEVMKGKVILELE